MADLAHFLAVTRREVDVTLGALIPAADVEPTKLHEAMRWSVFAGGKRVRPAIVYAVGETFSADPAKLARTAAAFELIHTYSLIHDDLPAMDDDDLRRGKATCHIQFGEATAILAGDAFQTLAFTAIADDVQLAPDIRIKLISLLARASGTPAGMVSGQQRDLEGQGKALYIDEIEQIHAQKTGALITAAAVSGAIIGVATEHEQKVIERFASKLGLLFQITDDLLDVTQETEKLGKTAGKDAASEKATYPGHYGVERAISMAETTLSEAYSELDAIESDTNLLRDLAAAIGSRTS